jgi:pilus assembly protein FimV
LHDQAPFVERRKNPVDVLRQALERDPTRGDLRLKLLELYYVAAEQNRRAFMEIAQHLAQSVNLASPQEWSQILDMGRKIAPNEPLFSQTADDQAVA